MIRIHGIKNCDTCRKARKWLDMHKIDHHYFDLRDASLPPAKVAEWLLHLGVDCLINSRGTTWKKLSIEERTNLTPERAINLILKHPTLIKRPIIEHAGTVTVGFSKEVQDRLLSDMH